MFRTTLPAAFLALVSAGTLASCNPYLDDEPRPSNSTNGSGSSSNSGWVSLNDSRCMNATSFYRNEKPTSIQVSFAGISPRVCAGQVVPITVFGKYTSFHQWCNGNHPTANYTTNSLDTSVACKAMDTACTPAELYRDQFLHYKGLSCANFGFRIIDSRTNANAGYVTSDCNLHIDANVDPNSLIYFTAQDQSGTEFSQPYVLRCN